MKFSFYKFLLIFSLVFLSYISYSSINQSVEACHNDQGSNDPDRDNDYCNGGGAHCTYRQGTTSRYNWNYDVEYTVEHNITYSNPTDISQTTIAYDRDISTSDFSSTYVKTYDLETRNRDTYDYDYDYWYTGSPCDLEGDNYEGSSYTNDQRIDWEDDLEATLNSTISWGSVTGTIPGGTRTWNVKACNPNNRCTGTITGYAYYATSIDWGVSDGYEVFNSRINITCNKNYPNNHDIDCSSASTLSTDTPNTNYRYQCAKYTYTPNTNHNKGPNCANFYYVTDVDVYVNSEKTYDVSNGLSGVTCHYLYAADGNSTKNCSATEVIDTTNSSGGKDNYRKRCFEFSFTGLKNTTYSDLRSDTDNCTFHYYVIDAELDIDDITYEDEATPTPTCTRIYSDTERLSCYNDNTGNSTFTGSEISRNTNEAKARYTYRYTSPNTITKTIDTTRYFVTAVEITGPTEVYTGEKFNYTCTATFGNNVYSKPISSKNWVWTSTPYQFIGTEWASVGYTSPNGDTFRSAVNQFYSVDPSNQTRIYTIKCKYYDQNDPNLIEWVWKKTSTSAHVPPKTASFAVTHYGISDMDVSVSGQFLTSPNRYTQVNNLLPNNNNKWDQYDFITGHWYDFKAEITYTDGRKRDVTAVNEIYWTSSPWYTFTPSSSDTGMSKDGNDHRIPRNGWNTISAEYFHQNVPYGTPGTGRTKLSPQLWAHQIRELQIKGSSYATNPKLSVVPDETVQYTAWVIWSDSNNNPFNRGTHENWTSVVYWDGDYKIGNGLYKFAIKGTNEKATVWARIVDINRLYGTHSNWDDHYDKEEITITGCNGVTHLAWNCATPPNYWAIDPLQGFGRVPSEPGHDFANFLPPPQQMGFGSWNDDNNPYYADHDFAVSGFSSGTGGKNDSNH